MIEPDQNTNQREKSTSSSLSLPNAVVIAGVLIAVAILVAGRGGSAGSFATAAAGQTAAAAPAVAQPAAGNLNLMRPVTSADHIRGNPNAPVKIVEYSDLECPFCKVFHATLQQAMTEYGASGQVAWVYRHFPLDSLHPKARKEAEASECAYDLGGNDAFWKYVDRVFEVTTSNNTLDPAQLPIIAQYVGLNVANFNNCLASGKNAQKVSDDEKNATDTGGTGTPWTIVVAENGQKFPVNGAMSYATLKQTIDQALQAK